MAEDRWRTWRVTEPEIAFTMATRSAQIVSP